MTGFFSLLLSKECILFCYRTNTYQNRIRLAVILMFSNKPLSTVRLVPSTPSACHSEAAMSPNVVRGTPCGLTWQSRNTLCYAVLTKTYQRRNTDKGVLSLTPYNPPSPCRNILQSIPMGDRGQNILMFNYSIKGGVKLFYLTEILGGVKSICLTGLWFFRVREVTENAKKCV